MAVKLRGPMGLLELGCLNMWNKLNLDSLVYSRSPPTFTNRLDAIAEELFPNDEFGGCSNSHPNFRLNAKCLLENV
jgi:hypothetical protein